MVGKSLKKFSNKGQEKWVTKLSIIDEHIHGLKTIKALMPKNILVIILKTKKQIYRNSNDKFIIAKTCHHQCEYLSTIVMVIVMWFGGQLVLEGDSYLSPQEFIGYILIFSQVIRKQKISNNIVLPHTKRVVLLPKEF